MAVAIRLGVVFGFVVLISIGFGALGATWEILPLFVRIVFAVCLLTLCGVLAVIVETWSSPHGPTS